jgi:hypothetical protein
MLPMSFFDNQEPFSRPKEADVDRVYRFAWHEFTEEDWERLDIVYRTLPGWIGYEPGPWWFGKDENKDEKTFPHLSASVEPPGLQVTGLLPKKEFETWHDAFMNAIRNFPAGEPN